VRATRVFALAAMLALVDGVAAVAGPSSAGSVVETLDGEDAECWFLLNLCRGYHLAVERAQTTPLTGRGDVILFKQVGQAEMAKANARSAADAIREKHGGKRLPCFDEPECHFLGE